MPGTRIEIGEDVVVRRDGEIIELPKSRKARGLFVFLLFQDRPVSRERLCEMFWEGAADPRGGLRWALTRLKRALGRNASWVVANRLTIAINAPEYSVTIDKSLGENLLTATASGDHDSYAAWLTDFRRRSLPTDNMGGLGDDNFHKLPHQIIRYTRAADGTRIAYAELGRGQPLLKAANWLSHLGEELEVSLWSGLYNRLAANHCLYRYDERGNGLSDWRVNDFSFDAFVSDLESVVDAIGLKRFPLLGISQGGAVSIEYAARHPERVSALVLIGAYPAGWRFHTDPSMVRRREAEMTLVEHGWGDNSPAYRQIFSHSFLPDASSEELDQFNEFQRKTTSSENAARFIDSFGDIDVRDRLAEVRAPALVLHSRDDQRIRSSVGEDLAASLPDARFEALQTANHVPIIGEPAFERMIKSITDFLRP